MNKSERFWLLMEFCVFCGLLTALVVAIVQVKQRGAAVGADSWHGWVSIALVSSGIGWWLKNAVEAAYRLVSGSLDRNPNTEVHHDH